MTADQANVILAVFTVIGVGGLGFVLVMGVRYFFTTPDKTGYQSKTVRANLYKLPR